MINKKIKSKFLGFLISSGAVVSSMAPNVYASNIKENATSETMRFENEDSVDINIIIGMLKEKTEEKSKKNVENIKHNKINKDLASTFVVGQSKIKIGRFFESMTDDNITEVQQYIDSAKFKNVGIAYNQIDHTDNKTSYVFGHNPGVMSPLARSVKSGLEVTIYDTNGVPAQYTLSKLTEIPKAPRKEANKGKAQDRKKSEEIIRQNQVLIDAINSDEESTIFQFCNKTAMEFWIAKPKIWHTLYF